jgi:hypothetical protein
MTFLAYIKSLDSTNLSKLFFVLLLKKIGKDGKQLINNVIILHDESIPRTNKFAAAIEVCIDAPGLVLSF